MSEVEKKNLTARVLNRMGMGNTRKIIDDLLDIRRVPGGFIYEYYDGDTVTACCFVSNDELVNE